MVEDKYNRVICEIRYPKKVYNVTMVSIEEVAVCQFTGCILSQIDMGVGGQGGTMEI
jgi:hypothetical protein